jgi:hypothetical protein
MKSTFSRRQFVKKSAVNAIGLGVVSNVPLIGQAAPKKDIKTQEDEIKTLKVSFVPVRAASWWVNIEDLMWPQKKIVDKIKYRAEAFAKAKIDTAINYGWHIRFDFSNYFGQMMGYHANVCEELHKYGIKFMDHYSCNHVERPRGDAEFRKLHKGNRHHVLLFHDPIAAAHAQYEGHFFNDICEVDIRDGSRGYARQYQMEAFCHNNPGFLDMHAKYLQRMMKEVPFDGIEVDDMCDYAGLTTCGCPHCRERFRKDYGHEIPPFDDKNFWGDTSKPMLQWGNYDNPVFRDFIKMKFESAADHVKMIKGIIGDKPLMSCCSSTGPIALNAISLNLETLAPYLDFFMLENVGTNINCVDWVRMDAEALQQKDIAQKRGNTPAMALSYTIYEKGGYLGWGLSRFWGVGNWASTHNQRLEEDPADARETEAIVGPYNNWEVDHSNWNYMNGKDLAEVRLVSSSYCRDNGWRGADGKEQWEKVKAWSSKLVKNNVGYRFVRSAELSDPKVLCKENTPLILDSLGCVSNDQFKAIKTYLSKGGTAWLSLPFGTHDEKGNKRNVPLSAELTGAKYRNLVLVESALTSDSLESLIQKGKFQPVLKQVSGDKGWVARIRIHEGKPVIHFMNTALIAIPHPKIKDVPGIPILNDIDSSVKNNKLSYEINTKAVPLPQLVVMSPEIGTEKRAVEIKATRKGTSIVDVNLEGMKVYAIAQQA